MQLRKNRYASYYDASIDDETLDNELASDVSDGLMSKEDKIKLDKMKVSGDGTVSVSVNASEIITDENNQFVTEQQKQILGTLSVTEEGEAAIDADNVITSETKQFVTAEQIKKIESTAIVEYDEGEEALIFS